jgi:hypothetical protein
MPPTPHSVAGGVGGGGGGGGVAGVFSFSQPESFDWQVVATTVFPFS